MLVPPLKRRFSSSSHLSFGRGVVIVSLTLRVGPFPFSSPYLLFSVGLSDSYFELFSTRCAVFCFLRREPPPSIDKVSKRRAVTLLVSPRLFFSRMTCIQCPELQPIAEHRPFPLSRGSCELILLRVSSSRREVYFLSCVAPVSGRLHLDN